MSKEETTKEIVNRIVEVDMVKVLESIMADTKRKAEEKARLISLADTTMHHLRLLRVGLE